MEPLRFGKYELAERIGTGGMAETWHARFAGPAGVQKSVVLKRIRPELAGDAQFTRMFINEARIAVTLSHGNIAQVFDFGEIDGEYFLAMEHVDGQNLSRVIRTALQAGLPGLPVPFALYITARMSEGLQYAHTRVDEQGRPLGLVHRDISPDNVMLSFDGQVKVIDFGIAKAVANDAGHTSPGVMKGKALYASPEQIQLQRLDRRSDVYSTGVVLYLMLTGRLPFEGQRHTVLDRILAGDWISPRLVNPAIPVEVEKLVYDAMARDRDGRIGSSQKLAELANGLVSKLAPSFSANWLEQLMGWLFTDELARQGREPHLDKGFSQQLTAWKSVASASMPSHVTLGPATQAEGAARKVAQKPPSRPVPMWARWTMSGGVTLAAIIAIALTVANIKAARTTLTINTVPILAEITIDGARQPRGSPLRAHVAAGVPHHIEVRAEGFEPFAADRTLEKGDEDRLDVRLERTPPPEPEPAPEPVVQGTSEPANEGTQVTPPSPEAALPVEASYPVAAFTLKASQHAVLVPGRPNVPVIALKPGVTYSVSTEGAYTYGYSWSVGKQIEGTSVNSTTALYFVEGATGPAFGEVGAKPLNVRGKNLYLFLPDNGAVVRKGALRVNVRAGSAAPQVVLLDPKRNALRSEPERQFLLRQLDSRVIYKFEVRSLEGGASLGASGRADRIVCARATSGLALGDAARQPRVSQVLEVGKPVEMTRLRELSCTLYDDKLDDNTGALEVKVVSMGVQPSDSVAMFDQLEKTGRISLYGVEFEAGSDRITRASEKYLTPVKQQLEREPAVQLSIEGHTDDRGSPAANEALSLARAEAVKHWFVSHGVTAARLSTKGFGERQPVADNALEEGRALNRRVDLVKR